MYICIHITTYIQTFSRAPSEHFTYECINVCAGLAKTKCSSMFVCSLSKAQRIRK